LIAPSCSLLHVPCDLDFETKLNPEVKQWLAFAKQKIDEVVTLKHLVSPETGSVALEKFKENQVALENREASALIHNDKVKQRVNAISEADTRRRNIFAVRKEKQREALNLP